MDLEGIGRIRICRSKIMKSLLGIETRQAFQFPCLLQGCSKIMKSLLGIETEILRFDEYRQEVPKS